MVVCSDGGLKDKPELRVGLPATSAGVMTRASWYTTGTTFTVCTACSNRLVLVPVTPPDMAATGASGSPVAVVTVHAML
jgi:hypothetical protein